MPRSAWRVATTLSTSCITMLSVSSSSRCSPMPDSIMMSPTMRRSPPVQSWRAERFTETIGAKPFRRHARPCSHAVFSTHSPIGTMSPVSSARGMLPAHQGLDRIHLAGAQVYARLVVQDQLMPLDRAAQAVLHREALDGELVHLDGEELERPAAGRFRAV